MAEHVMKTLVSRAGIADRFEISSAAISTEEIWMGHGNPMDHRAQRTLKSHGIPFEPGEARQITKRDFLENDLVILMDRGNLRGLRRLLGNIVDEAPAGKVRLLLDPAEVTDPWYSGDFEKAYRDIEKGCRQLLEECAKKAIVCSGPLIPKPEGRCLWTDLCRLASKARRNRRNSMPSSGKPGA